ncbi:hypothetical protein LTR42_000863 [Elasticomyces elasticus]|nr:hypothetical protein LTR42_000863 [Elasticomyces elasticus]
MNWPVVPFAAGGGGYGGYPNNLFGGSGGYGGYGQMGPFGYGGLDPRLAQLYGYPFSPFAIPNYGYDDDQYDDYEGIYNSGFVNGAQCAAMMVQMGGGGGWSGGGRYGGSRWGGRGNVVLGAFLEGVDIVAADRL